MTLQGLLWPLLSHLVLVRNQDTEKSCTFELKLCVLARGQQAFLTKVLQGRYNIVLLGILQRPMVLQHSLLSKMVEFSRFSPAEKRSAIFLP